MDRQKKERETKGGGVVFRWWIREASKGDGSKRESEAGKENK